MFLGYRALLQDNACLYFIDRQYLFLWLFSPIYLLASAAERFAINCQMDMAIAWLYH